LSNPVPEGHHEFRFEFEPTTPLVFGIAGAAVAYGVDGPSPVAPHDYAPSNAFTGTANSVTVDVSGELIEDDEATMRRLMAHQ